MSEDDIFIRFVFTKWEYYRLKRHVNDYIVEMQKEREKHNIPIDAEAMKRCHPRLMRLMDKLLYGGEDLGAFAEYKRKVKELNESHYENEYAANVVCPRCLTYPCHCDSAELN